MGLENKSNLSSTSFFCNTLILAETLFESKASILLVLLYFCNWSNNFTIKAKSWSISTIKSSPILWCNFLTQKKKWACLTLYVFALVWLRTGISCGTSSMHIYNLFVYFGRWKFSKIHYSERSPNPIHFGLRFNKLLTSKSTTRTFRITKMRKIHDYKNATNL